MTDSLTEYSKELKKKKEEELKKKKEGALNQMQSFMFDWFKEHTELGWVNDVLPVRIAIIMFESIKYNCKRAAVDTIVLWYRQNNKNYTKEEIGIIYDLCKEVYDKEVG